MVKILFILAFISCNLPGANAQEIKIPMQPASWEYDSSAVQFTNYRGTPAVMNKNGKYYQIFLKNHIFRNGTIEFDVALTGAGFPGINFRMSADRKKGENFYIRSFGPVTPEKRTTLQYAALIDGNSIWDLTDEYQAGAVIHQDGWNHVKLVVSGKQMKVYVNDMTKPALRVPELEGEQDAGNIALTGNVLYANLVIKPDATEGLSPEAGYISASGDPRYLRNWMLSPPVPFPFGKDILIPLPSMHGEINGSSLPDSTTKWTAIKAESRGIVNLTRKYGFVEHDARRLAWLKTTLNSDRDQERVLSMGFSDEAWVFINGQILYTGKNYFGTPAEMEKGRCIIENTRFRVPLRKGDNEILIGLANYFYGWGIIARMDTMDGITIR